LTRTNPTTKYLRSHAEVEASQRISLSRRYRHVACIPVCNEGDSLTTTLTTLADAEGSDEALVILIINARETAPADVHQTNQAQAQTLQTLASLSDAPMAEGSFRGMGIVLVDRYSEGRRFPKKQGVGLARKIIGDLAVAWMEDGSIEERWMRCTDADARVPADYWQRTAHQPSGHSAVIYPFAHVPEGDDFQRQAMVYYDAYLRYYAHGLGLAGSPYAFPTIGSLLCIDGDAYAKVRGFPKRLAGEDFYILNKLAKVGRVETLSGQPILLEGRTSDRVPFGTGVAVVQIRELLTQGQPYEVYNPQIFTALKHWLDALDVAAKTEDAQAFQKSLDAVPDPLGPVLRQAVQVTGSQAPVEHALNEVKGRVLRKRIDDWNDAFRTLKMVHALRDEGLGTVPADDALKAFTSDIPS